ncbi:carboxypeptidase C prc1, partial [Modicella reniformis]
PKSQQDQEEDDDDEPIWQVIVDLDRFILKKDHLLLAAEIEDLMITLENHCHELGLDAANITHLLVLPITAPTTLTTRQALHRACDDLYQVILRRQERIERWVSRIIIIAENIREPPEPLLKVMSSPAEKLMVSAAWMIQGTDTSMQSTPFIDCHGPNVKGADAAGTQLEKTYRALEKEWIERLERFRVTVGKLRMRWIQCAYMPTDDYDHALCKLFELAETHDRTAKISYLQIEDPLCLSRECLANLSAKLYQLDQNFYTRLSRIRTMENVLGSTYQDLGRPTDKRVVFRNEGTVRYAAELGRELKALQLELAARKLYLSGERWNALTTVWDMCLVSEQERESFRASVEHDDVAFVEKLDRIQSEIENCKVRFSKSSAIYKLMITRRNHIEEMISFEQTACNPERLFQPSFQLVEEEKVRKRAYTTLVRLENTLIGSIEKFENEHEDTFVYEGIRYLETLQSEIAERHVNQTAFAKFTPVIAAPTRSQTTRIM